MTPRLPNSFAASGLAAVLLASLAGCVSAESQLRTGLMRAGVSERMAGCMARPMAEQLSSEQVRKLRSLGQVSGLDPRRASYDEMIQHVRALGDPEIIRITMSAALGCSLR